MALPTRARGSRLAFLLARAAVLCQVVAPLWMGLLAGAPAEGGLVPVCTLEGIRWIALDDTSAPAGEHPTADGSICPGCVIAGAAFVPPPVTVAPRPFAPGRAVHREAAPLAPAAAALFEPRQSRAPPARA